LRYNETLPIGESKLLNYKAKYISGFGAGLKKRLKIVQKSKKRLKKDLK